MTGAIKNLPTSHFSLSVLISFRTMKYYLVLDKNTEMHIFSAIVTNLETINFCSRNNYEKAGTAIGQELVNNPDLVATDATISFKTAIWFWMTPQDNKPSSHDVIIGRWTPSAADQAANRVPGYGVITNIINGGIECGIGRNDAVEDRIGYYRRYCGMLNVAPGENLDCYNQRNFAQG